MYSVYILLLSNKQLYVGVSRDIRRRLQEHKQGKSPFTKNRLPVTLIFCETFVSQEDAERRERYFKTSKGKSTIKLMLRSTLKKIK